MTTQDKTTEVTDVEVKEVAGKKTRAEIIEAKIARAEALAIEHRSFDEKTGVGATNVEAFNIFMTEQGHDVARLNEAEKDKIYYATGVGRSFAKPFVDALVANPELNDVEAFAPMLDGQSLTFKGERERTYTNPSNPEAPPVVKTLPVRLVYEQTNLRAVGPIKAMLNSISAQAAEALGK